jgi:dTDP-4-amino-4,6-dideoxygalactose transaminase
MIIPHSKPTVGTTDAKIVADIVKSGHMAQGQKVASFERKFARYQKVNHAVAVNSGTSALHLSLLALGVKKGDNVIIPSFVCTALMNALRYTGAQVRIADVGEDDFNISVESVKKEMNKRTKAIVVPHMFGLPADLTALLKLRVPVIEDCAQALGATYKGRKVGSLGILSIYSFYATKMITTGEGGMVTSNNSRLIERIRDWRDYDEKPGYALRYNYKMTDIQAALGIHQLSQLPAWITKRREAAQMYQRALNNCGLKLPRQFAEKKHVYFRYVIQTDNKRKLLNKLRSKGIEAVSPVYKPLHRYLGLKGYPCTDRLMRTCVSLPIYPSLSKRAVQYIIKELKGHET